MIDKQKKCMEHLKHFFGYLIYRWRYITIFGTLFGLLAYVFAISIRLPVAQRVMPLATIATGFALAVVAFLTYLLERRSFLAAHEPSLGILWKNPTMYPSTAIKAEEEQDIYAEYIMWNAGDVPILILQPSLVLDKRIGPMHLRGGKVEIEHVFKGETVIEKAFPIVLGKSETCIWRQFTGDKNSLRPQMSNIVEDSREKAIEFLQKQECNKRFLFAVTYFGKPPHEVKKADLRRQYVVFCYKESRKDKGPSIGPTSIDNEPSVSQQR